MKEKLATRMMQNDTVGVLAPMVSRVWRRALACVCACHARHV